jgi:hypothetical protein
MTSTFLDAEFGAPEKRMTKEWCLPEVTASVKVVHKNS